MRLKITKTIKERLNSRDLNAIKKIPETSLKAYAERNEKNIGKILSSRSAYAIKCILEPPLEKNKGNNKRCAGNYLSSSYHFKRLKPSESENNVILQDKKFFFTHQYRAGNLSCVLDN